MKSIFRIDWISVDIIIIILLVLLLISVKIFKITHRWRYPFSNQALENLSYSTSHRKGKDQMIIAKKWCLTKNLSIKDNSSNLPLILIFRTKKAKKLFRILTEGLSSYGFNVINIKAKIKLKIYNNELEKTLIDEWKSLISDIFDIFKKREVMVKSNYVLIDYSKNLFQYNHILSNSFNKGVIMINPKINNRNSSKYSELYKIDSLTSNIYTLFSRKSLFFLNNKNLKKFLKDILPQKNFNLKHLTIEKAKNSFKYYETILLGMIIDIIENKLLKSEF